MKEENFVGNAHYATDFLGNTYQFDCMGCAVSKGKIIPPGGVIYEDENFIVASDPEIPIRGFLIINTKRHINSLIEMSEEERHGLIDLVNIGIQALKDLKIVEEVTIFQEERSQHFHMWIFPNHSYRREKFGEGISVIRSICKYAQKNVTQKEIEEILETVEKIREYFEKRCS